MEKEDFSNQLIVEPVKKTNKNLIITLVIIGVLLLLAFLLVYLLYSYFSNVEIVEEENLTEEVIVPVINITQEQNNQTNTTQPITTNPSTGGGSGGSSSNGGGGGDNGGCTPNLTCSYYYNLSQCGSSLSDGCENILSCLNCGQGKECVNNSCVELPDCTSDSDCVNLTGACGTGTCNTITGQCYINYSSSSVVCRNNVTECDSTEYCTGSSVNCPADVNKSDGAL